MGTKATGVKGHVIFKTASRPESGAMTSVAPVVFPTVLVHVAVLFCVHRTSIDISVAGRWRIQTFCLPLLIPPCSLTYLYLFSLPSLSRLIAGFSASNKVQVPAVEGDLHLRLNMRTSLPEPHPRLTSSSLSPIDLRMLLSDCRFITRRLLYNS